MINELLHWKWRVDGPVAFKGGGGGGGYVDYETPRRQAAVAHINQMFGSRDTRRPAYEAHAGNVRAFHQNAINEDAVTAERELRDALARQSLTTGAVDIDQHGLLERKKAEGYVEAGRKADVAASDLEAADEATKQGLVNQVNAGMDQESAGQNLLQGIEGNRQRAASADITARINNFFRNIGAIYETQQVPGLVAAGRAGQQQTLASYINPPGRYSGTGPG